MSTQEGAKGFPPPTLNISRNLLYLITANVEFHAASSIVIPLTSDNGITDTYTPTYVVHNVPYWTCVTGNGCEENNTIAANYVMGIFSVYTIPHANINADPTNRIDNFTHSYSHSSRSETSSFLFMREVDVSNLVTTNSNGVRTLDALDILLHLSPVNDSTSSAASLGVANIRNLALHWVYAPLQLYVGAPNTGDVSSSASDGEPSCDSICQLQGKSCDLQSLQELNNVSSLSDFINKFGGDGPYIGGDDMYARYTRTTGATETCDSGAVCFDGIQDVQVTGSSGTDQGYPYGKTQDSKYTLYVSRNAADVVCDAPTILGGLFSGSPPDQRYRFCTCT